MTKKCLRKCFERAFKVWEEVADVSFSEATTPPEDIKIKSGQNIENIAENNTLKLLPFYFQVRV